jgi:transcriptional regulator with XRE-family HTH domain
VPRRRVEEPDHVERAIARVVEAERRTLADGVRQRRLALGWTQQRLAEESRLSVIYISHLELARPNVNPTLRALAALAHALDCRVSDLGRVGAVAAAALPASPSYRFATSMAGTTPPQLLVAEPPAAPRMGRRESAAAKPAALHGVTRPRKAPPKKRG